VFSIDLIRASFDGTVKTEGFKLSAALMSYWFRLPSWCAPNLCDVNEGGKRQQGERYGVIQIGSRVDLFLPEDYSVTVALGDFA
jgi:phosphatidylserine decarboxylase